MNENPFEQQIKELKAGEISELIIEPKDFMLFREVWKELPERASIVGEAGLNGRIIYHYKPDSQ